MEEPFSRIPGIFPKTLSENQKEKYFKKPIDKSGKYAIIQKLSDTDMQNQILGGIAQLGAQSLRSRTPSSNFIVYQFCSVAYPIRGYSSAGRALEWHSRGQRFDPAYLHQKVH